MAQQRTRDAEELADRLRRTEEEVEAVAREVLRRRRGGRASLRVFLAMTLALWLASGVQLVQTGERGVVQTLGRHTATAEPGLSYRLPWPLQRVSRVDVESTRRVQLSGQAGTRATDKGREGRPSEHVPALTRDGRLVALTAVVEYHVNDPAAHLFNVRDPEQVLLTTTESALSSVVGQRPLGSVLSLPSTVQEEVRTLTQALLDRYRSGIQVTEVQFGVGEVLR